MNKGRINKTASPIGDIPQVTGKGFCAHKADGGEKLKDGRILPG
jgi:hypothetical protein